MRNFYHVPYRPDIDGLRAVAVISVLIFHAFPSVLPGGFSGVDIFFVISGYLISSIVFSQLEGGSFSIFGFYVRRIRRIFPALIAVLSVCILVGWFFLFSDEFKQLGLHTAGGVAFIANFLLWHESGAYFSAAVDTKPLLHLWSLAIEEQFYLFWPLLLAFVWKRKWGFLRIIAVIALASFAVNLYLIGHDQTGAFYSPFARFWELMVGGVLGYINLHRADLNARHKDVQSWLGVMLLAAGLVLLNGSRSFPGWWALLPCIGAFLLLSAGPDAWFNRKILASKPMVWVGLISYPLYLWHWPLLAFGRLIYPSEVGLVPVGVRVILVVVSIALAFLTYRVIELPVRVAKSGMRIIYGLCAAMGVLAIAGILIYGSKGMQFRAVAMASKEIVEAKDDWRYNASRYENGHIVNLQVLEGRSADSALFIGDSVMGQNFPRAQRLYADQSTRPYLSAVFASRDHCLPLPYSQFTSTPEKVRCEDYYSAAMRMAKDPRYKKVVLGGYWAGSVPGYKTAESGEKLISDIRELIKDGKEVVIISTPPHSSLADPMTFASYYRFAGIGHPISHRPDVIIPREEMEKWDMPSLSFLQTISKMSGAKLVNPYNYFCTESVCPIFLNDQPLFIDGHHIRASVVQEKALFIDEILAISSTK